MDSDHDWRRRVDSNPDTKTIENLRKQNAELLAALEGIMASPMSTRAMLAAHAAIRAARG